MAFLYANSGDTSPPPALAQPGSPAVGTSTPAPSPSAGTSGSSSGSASGVPGGLSASTLPRITYTAPGPGGFTLAPPQGYPIVLRVTSAAPIVRVGYLMPTSHESPSGDIRHVGRSWQLTSTVYGSPAYAAIFVQAGRDGTPITCTVTVNGTVTDSRTTKGAYGRQVCLG